MFQNILRRPNSTTELGKVKIVKNLIVISLSLLFIYSGDDGLITLQTTMNKEDGVGTISAAINFISFGFASLIFISFLVKKFGSKNAQILGIIMMLPYIVSNVYPTWITMLPAAVLRGIGCSLLWAAKCTYFNESSVLFCKAEKGRRKSIYTSDLMPNHEKSDIGKDTNLVKSHKQKVEQLSAFDLFIKADNNPVSNNGNTKSHVNVSPVRFTVFRYKNDDAYGNKSFSEGQSSDRTKEVQGQNLKIFNNTVPSNTLETTSKGEKEEILLNSSLEIIEESDETEKNQSYIDSNKSFFFGIHGLAYQSACVFSSLISYYILKTCDKEDFNNITTISCGASFCSANEVGFNVNIKEVPDETRYLLIGVCTTLAFVAPLMLLLFLDGISKKKEDVKLSWEHIFATIKYIKKKDQLLLIPFTIGVALCRGFYITDFTKLFMVFSSKAMKKLPFRVATCAVQ